MQVMKGGAGVDSSKGGGGGGGCRGMKGFGTG